jgi:hypothetical protein
MTNGFDDCRVPFEPSLFTHRSVENCGTSYRNRRPDRIGATDFVALGQSRS